MALIKDSLLEFPDLWLTVYLAGENALEDALLRKLFVRGRCSGTDEPENADLIVFGGGVDVTPGLYGKFAHGQTHYNRERDRADMKLFRLAYEKGIPMTGICRGAQFGHVMLGGSLYQHVDGHQSSHAMFLPEEQRSITRVSSVHHQMIIPNENTRVLGIASGRSTKRYIDVTNFESGSHKDTEAFFYEEACFLGVQGHPEYSGFEEFSHWYLNAVASYLLGHPAVSYDKEVRCYRLEKHYMEQRKNLVRDYDMCTEVFDTIGGRYGVSPIVNSLAGKAEKKETA